MKYQGGKTRLAPRIAQAILEYGAGRELYLEPFLGSAAVLARVAPNIGRAVVSDSADDLMLMWNAARNGWVPPTALSRVEYEDLRRQSHASALRGFAGYACSYAGKWFGGYATGHPGEDFARAGSRSVVARSVALRSVDLYLADYREMSDIATAQAVVYADPPYAGTTGYGATGAFDSRAFWDEAAVWRAQGAVVLVSERTAPAGWHEVWRLERQNATHRLNQGTIPEALFLGMPT